ncbi:MAG: hypothetical protein GY715_17545 [Planctomycetes bacterium]|nr:hypothetical protein [Planctomycetota bacterium]
MRIRVRPSRRRSERIALNLASMIDVVFLLLAYFMMTMEIWEREDRLTPTLQTQRDSASGETTDFQPQVVEVLVLDGAPAYRLGPRSFGDATSLRAALEPLPKSVGVFVKVFDGVPVGFAVSAIQACRDTGFEQVTYEPAK